jgi:hypothetical protein
LTDDSGKPIATSIDVLFGNSNLDVTATKYVLNPDWVGTISGGDDLALVKLDTPVRPRRLLRPRPILKSDDLS